MPYSTPMPHVSPKLMTDLSTYCSDWRTVQEISDHFKWQYSTTAGYVSAAVREQYLEAKSDSMDRRKKWYRSRATNAGQQFNYLDQAYSPSQISPKMFIEPMAAFLRIGEHFCEAIINKQVKYPNVAQMIRSLEEVTRDYKSMVATADVIVNQGIDHEATMAEYTLTRINQMFEVLRNEAQDL